MKKYLNKFYQFIDKIGKPNFILLVFFIALLVVTSLYQTFSLYTSSEGISIIDGIKTFKFILNNNNTENSVTIAAGSSKNIAITVSNEEEITLKYGVYYTSSEDLSDIDIGYKKDTEYLPNGSIDAKEDYTITIQMENNYSDYIALNKTVSKNFEVTESTLKSLNSFTDDMSVSNITITDSSGEIVATTLEEYDVYKVTFNIDGTEVEQNIIPVPSESITLTNVLENGNFESELSGYYNGTAYRSTTINHGGSYSMYFNCDSSQAFLRINHGDLGTKDHTIYVRTYAHASDTSLKPLLYIYETETNVNWPENSILRKYAYFSTDVYNDWGMWSYVIPASTTSYDYLLFQYSQGSTTGTGSVYWDDSMVLVLDTDVWDTIPTTAWFDTVIPDFTGSYTFEW